MGHRHGCEPGSNGVRTRAQVIARWENRQVLLRLTEGSTLEAQVPPAIRDIYDVGDSAWVELASDGTVAVWGLATG